MQSWNEGTVSESIAHQFGSPDPLSTTRSPVTLKETRKSIIESFTKGDQYAWQGSLKEIIQVNQ